MNPRGQWERQALREEESPLRAAPEGDEGEKKIGCCQRDEVTFIQMCTLV